MSKENDLKGLESNPQAKNLNTIIKRLLSLSGREAVDQILESDSPKDLVRSLSHGDFFWLIKKIGYEDCLPLLEIASIEQWQHLFDLEAWRKYRVDPIMSSKWLALFAQADLRRLVGWLSTEGAGLASYYLYRNIEVIIREDDDEILELPEDFFSLEGIFYVRVIDSKNRETIENILKAMSEADYSKYYALVSGLAGVLPAELGEELYRIRNVRLAEYGFLPMEEALEVYAPLVPETLSFQKPQDISIAEIDEKNRDFISLSAFSPAEAENILTKVVLSSKNEDFFGRFQLEFSGLCNQILAADGLIPKDLSVLTETCIKAAGYINLALERISEGDIHNAEQIIINNSLQSIFRVGLGFILGLKWEVEHWLKRSWFNEKGFSLGFWGDEWSKMLEGLLEDRPRVLRQTEKGVKLRDFKEIAELDKSRKLFYGIIVLDALLASLSKRYPLNREPLEEDRAFTFHALIFTFWTRKLLKLKGGFSSIGIEQFRTALQYLRTGEKRAPYQMQGFGRKFIDDIKSCMSNVSSEVEILLDEVLRHLWEEFCSEYENIAPDAIDRRYVKFVFIEPTSHVLSP